MELVDRTAELRDFADTAALIANLDLVICADTAVARRLAFGSARNSILRQAAFSQLPSQSQCALNRGPT